MIDRTARFARRNNLVAWVATAALALFLILFFVRPALGASGALDDLREEEKPAACVQRSEEQVLASIPRGDQARAQEQAQSDAQAARRQDAERQTTACLTVDGNVIASRANLIAIESATATIGATFIAFIAAVAGIFATGAALLTLVRTRNAPVRSMLVPRFVAGIADPNVGELVVSHVGGSPALVREISINRDATLHSAQGNGLRTLQAGEEVRYAVTLEAVRSRSLLVIVFEDVAGTACELRGQFAPLGGRWHLVDLRQYG